jgi:hypothetical protein
MSRSKKGGSKKGKSSGDVEGGDVYVVEAIVDHRFEYGVKKYLLKWEGWPAETNTWEEESHLFSCPALLAKYNELHPAIEEKTTPGRGKAKANVIEPVLVEEDSPKKKQKVQAKQEEAEEEKEEKEYNLKEENIEDDGENIEPGFRIEGARLTADETIEFYVCNDGKRQYLPSKLLHKENPQLVIDFYESRLIFENKSNKKLEGPRREKKGSKKVENSTNED